MKRRYKKEEIFQPIPFTARSENQRDYIKLINNKDMVFCAGSAGSGKTFCAVGSAVYHLNKCLVEKIVITRPVVEAGESLGALPGGPEEKIYPYLLPIFDELKHFISYSDIHLWKNSGILEIAPMAYLRGRTFLNSFIIVDEAQNCTYKQLKLAMTRMGIGSKMVLTGDITQSDLQGNKSSGFGTMMDLFSKNTNFGTIFLQDEDIVRHPLVKEISKTLTEYETSFKIPGVAPTTLA